MDRLKIIVCAYRSWGLNIMYQVRLLPHVDVENIKNPDELTVEKIDAIKPSLIFFCGWSWRVPQEIIDKYLCLCMHPSPLPKYRGGSPLQHQILAGEKVTKLSIFRMNHIIDGGDLCAQMDMTLYGSMKEIFEHLTYIGYILVHRVIDMWLMDDLKFWPQEGEPTVYKRRRPEESEITAEEMGAKDVDYLYNKIRALQDPYPNAYITCIDGRKLYLTEAHIDEP